MTAIGVLLAAGVGARLSPHIRDVPKPLARVAGRPLVAHALDGMVAAGIRDVVIVTGYRGEMIEAEIGNGAANDIAVTYVRQADPTGPVDGLLAAAGDVGDAPSFGFAAADTLVPPAAFQHVVRAARLTGASVAVVPASADGRRLGRALSDASGDGHIVAHSSTMAEDASGWQMAGFGVLPAQAWRCLQRHAGAGDEGLPGVVADLADSGVQVRTVPVPGYWFDVDTPAVLAEAQRLLGGRP